MTRRLERGFTLLEALVAFAILALGLVVVFDIWNSATQRASVNRQRAIALNLAQSLLDEQLGLRLNAIGTSSGTFPNSFSWQIDRAPFPTSSPISGFAWSQMSIIVKIQWTEISGPQSLAIASIALTK